MSNESYLDVRGVADMLGRSTRWVYEKARKNLIPHYKLPDDADALRFDRDEIRRWLAAGCPPNEDSSDGKA